MKIKHRNTGEVIYTHAGANLSDANLSDADLRGANLSGAVGYISLTHTAHGYPVGASWRDDRWMIMAGYRKFTIAQARDHWGSEDYHHPQTGSLIIAVLDWLEKQPTPKEGQ